MVLRYPAARKEGRRSLHLALRLDNRPRLEAKLQAGALRAENEARAGDLRTWFQATVDGFWSTAKGPGLDVAFIILRLATDVFGRSWKIG